MLDATIEAHNIWDDQTAVSFWEQLKENKNASYLKLEKIFSYPTENCIVVD
jgi:hypothetical protein